MLASHVPIKCVHYATHVVDNIHTSMELSGKIGLFKALGINAQDNYNHELIVMVLKYAAKMGYQDRPKGIYKTVDIDKI